MKKIIITIILSQLISTSFADCATGNCLPGQVMAGDTALASLGKVSDFDEENFIMFICGEFRQERQSFELYRHIRKTISDHYAGKKNVLDMNSSVICKVDSEENLGEEIDATPLESYALTGSYNMILYTIQDYEDVNLEGVKKALLESKSGKTVLQILQDDFNVCVNGTIKNQIGRVINKIKQVLGVATV